MKKLIYLFSIVVLLASCQTVTNKKAEVQCTKKEKVPKMLVGGVQLSDLKAKPYSEWFDEGFAGYVVDSATLANIDMSGISAVVVFGTWCGDSQREVPRFAKIAQYIGFDNFKLIAINRKKEAKETKVKSLDIQRVPTFIFYRDSVELGRIIESPKQSIEKDLFGILNLTK